MIIDSRKGEKKRIILKRLAKVLEENKITKINTIQDILTELKNTLENQEANQEAKIIVETVLNLESSELISNSQNQLSRNQIQKILEIHSESLTNVHRKSKPINTCR
jgi:hypothetical protein